jgi:leucyl aminopeptidase (aminopeptidase T)
MNKELQKSSLIALRDCLNLKENENLLVLTDDRTQTIGQALFEVGKEIGNESVLVVMPEREVNGQEPPDSVAELMTRFDVVICPTAKSLTHTTARRNACEAGARVGTMPGITEEVMIRTMGADYHKIAERTYKLSEILDPASKVHVTSAAGTDIMIPIQGINAISSTGLVTEKGKYGNLPSGESFLMPEEGKTNGVFVVDASFAGVGKIETEPIRITVENGYAVKIEGGIEAKKLDEMLKPLGHEAYNVAELGIGTNDEAIVTGMILEDEKVMGTAHIALGNNMSMGGTCNVGVHVDGVFFKPTIKVDNQIIVQDGNLLID